MHTISRHGQENKLSILILSGMPRLQLTKVTKQIEPVKTIGELWNTYTHEHHKPCVPSTGTLMYTQSGSGPAGAFRWSSRPQRLARSLNYRLCFPAGAPLWRRLNPLPVFCLWKAQSNRRLKGRLKVTQCHVDRTRHDVT